MRLRNVIDQPRFQVRRVGPADVDGADQVFQVSHAHPRRQCAAVPGAHGLVAQWQARQVLQGQFEERQGPRLRIARQNECAPDHHAGDADLDVINVHINCCGMVLEHCPAQGIAGEGLQAVHFTLKGFAIVGMLHRGQVQQMPAVAGLIGGGCGVQPRG